MQILVGDEHINCTPVMPYDELVCDLLEAWSQAIRGDSEAKAHPDVLTFGFFIRRGSIVKKKEAFLRKNEGSRRLGRGLAFHVAPSNVPVNCMYTLVFGLLAGCANIVRVPSKEFPQVDILCRTLDTVLKKHKFSDLADRIQVLRYEREECLPDGRGRTEFFSSICDVRVIWGGDDTIAQIRKHPIATRAKEITFADRYSVGILSAEAVLQASDDELKQLAKDFYNDTYLMDQNACSTPHLIAWTTDTDASKAQERFWPAVAVYGVDTKEVADWIVERGFFGVDRVVPFGKTLDIDVVWDGYDLIAEMSRIVAG